MHKRFPFKRSHPFSTVRIFLFGLTMRTDTIKNDLVYTSSQKKKNKQKSIIMHRSKRKDMPKTSSPSNNQECNKPRNHIVKDATSLFTFSYKQYGQTKNVSVNQTPAEDTWTSNCIFYAIDNCYTICVTFNK